MIKKLILWILEDAYIKPVTNNELIGEAFVIIGCVIAGALAIFLRG